MKRKAVCVILLVLLLVSSIFGSMSKVCEASAAARGTVTADSLRVRTDAGTDKAVLTYKGTNVALSNGTEVTIQSEKKAAGVTWYKVSFTYQGTSLTGYVSGDYIKLEEDTDNPATDTGKEDTNAGLDASNAVVIAKKLSIPAKVKANKMNVRTAASTSASKLTVSGKNVVLEKGVSVKILKEILNGNEKWYYASFTYNKKTQKGYLLGEYIGLVLTRDVSANVYSSEVKLRKNPGADEKVKKYKGEEIVLKQGTEVLILKEKKDADGVSWYKVKCGYQGVWKKGFVSALDIVLNKVIPVQGKVTTDNLRVRSGAGTNYPQLTEDNANVYLQKGQLLTITAQTKVGNVTWYKVSFDYKGQTLNGYVSGDYVTLVEYELDLGKPDDSNEDNENKDDPNTDDANTDKDDSNKKDENTGTGNENGGNTGNAGNDTGNSDDTTNKLPEVEPIEDIDAFLAEQGFPESYKEGLKALHKAHPTWIFKAYHTGLSWEDVISNESKVGLNLITNNKTNGWKSYEAKAYNYATDKFIAYDGSTWVTASKEAVAYYMDPRNFMTERGIFQFLTLEYQNSYENKAGVEAILANTPFYNKEYTYIDEETGEVVTKYYSDTFIDAAKSSGVSSYHLATRVKQEVVSNSTTLSGSVTGAFSGYEGYYNFYNIGATHSTQAGGAIANGLDFAMGNKSDAAAKATYMLPWNNQYKAIVGGASYIGSQYINRGQNTIYLQKFNVTKNSTYSHQYMANVEAANSEAIKLYNGYTSILDTSLVFYIPVYENMPSEKAAVPGSIPSPNNWLKSLTVDNYALTPSFDASAGSSQPYVLSMELEDEEVVNLKAVAVNSKATITVKVRVDGTYKKVSDTGDAWISLLEGQNEVEIIVTAENGDTNTYKLTISK